MPFWKSTPESRARNRFREVFRDFENAKYDVKINLVHVAWEDNEVRASIAQFFEDPDPDIRYKACFIAGVISEEDAEMIKPFSAKLIMLLEDKSSNWVGIHSYAKLALQHIAQKDPEILRAVIPKLVKRLADRDEWEFDPDTPGFSAGNGLASIAQNVPDVIKPFVPQLLDLLEDPRDYVRSSVAFAVGMMGDKQPDLVQPCITKLTDLLGDHSKHVRYSAARGLAYIGHKDAKLVEQAIPKLVDLLTDSDNKVRLAAVTAVGDIADTEPKAVVSATPALLRLVKNPDWIVSEKISEAAKEVLLEDYDWMVSEAAKEVLQKISRRS